MLTRKGVWDRTFKPDVNIFYYYEPTFRMNMQGSRQGVRFENMSKSRIPWEPHFDFANETDEVVVTDESFWYDVESNIVFGRKNLVPKVQERFDHSAFPFDRQIIDLQLMSNNVMLRQWELLAPGSYPVELSLMEDEWVLQTELAAVADLWDLHDTQVQLLNDDVNCSSSAHFQIFLQRASRYFVVNIAFVYFLIISAQTCMVIFAYNESRIEFAMALALTSVAFLFVSSTLVPKTSYLSYLDKYFILGLVLLAGRFAADTVMQLSLEIPVGPEGYKGDCDAIPDVVNICNADAIVTAVLSLSWFAASFVFICLGGRLLRPSWYEMNRIIQKGSAKSRVEYEIMGKMNMKHESRLMRYADMENSVDIKASNQEFARVHD